MKISSYNLFIPCDDEILLFNTLSGETFKIDEYTKEALKNKELEKIDSIQKQEFYDKNIIIDDEVNEKNIIDYYHNKTKYANPNLTYTLLLTWACNLRCVYCYEGAGEDKSYSMNKSTASNIIDHIKNESINRGSKTIGIILFGGEPLINFEIGKYILKELKKHCIDNSIELYTGVVTNGTLLTRKIIEDLIYFNCQFIQITLDGTKKIHDARRIGKNEEGTFDRIISNLKLLNKYNNKIKTIIRINVDKNNATCVCDLLEYLNEQGLNDYPIDFGIVRSSTESCLSYDDNCYIEDETADLLSELWLEASNNGFDTRQRPIRKWTYCGLNNDNSLTNEPNGDVYKCWEHTVIDKHKIGEIGENGIIENIQPSFYDWMTRNPLNIKECSDCIYLPACGGGCGSVSYSSSKTYKTEGCLKIKGVIEEQVKNWYKSTTKEI
ncbi:MAG: Cys-every-fifth radical SAM/SPASM peptide maturase CefB [Peptoniphilaceae bacterium]|nr:Cys-every-fifth radical SAM/SPASM peptide maturase CefB [Peptoniphilaceae bacterium]